MQIYTFACELVAYVSRYLVGVSVGDNSIGLDRSLNRGRSHRYLDALHFQCFWYESIEA